MADAIFVISEIIFLAAFLFKDILCLRAATIVALAGCMVALIMGYNLDWMKSLLIFNTLGILVNLYHIHKAVMDRYPIMLPEELKDIYKRTFNKMTTNEFFKGIYKRSFHKTYEKGENLISQDKHVENLIYIRKGEVEIVKDNVVVATLPSGFFLGEMSFLSQQPANADVRALSDRVDCMLWSKKDLHQLQKSHLEVFTKLQQVISLDLINKLNKNIKKEMDV